MAPLVLPATCLLIRQTFWFCIPSPLSSVYKVFTTPSGERGMFTAPFWAESSRLVLEGRTGRFFMPCHHLRTINREEVEEVGFVRLDTVDHRSGADGPDRPQRLAPDRPPMRATRGCRRSNSAAPDEQHPLTHHSGYPQHLRFVELPAVNSAGVRNSVPVLYPS
jgi:hypothetical protein